MACVYTKQFSKNYNIKIYNRIPFSMVGDKTKIIEDKYNTKTITKISQLEKFLKQLKADNYTIKYAHWETENTNFDLSIEKNNERVGLFGIKFVDSNPEQQEFEKVLNDNAEWSARLI